MSVATAIGVIKVVIILIRVIGIILALRSNNRYRYRLQLVVLIYSYSQVRKNYQSSKKSVISVINKINRDNQICWGILSLSYRYYYRINRTLQILITLISTLISYIARVRLLVLERIYTIGVLFYLLSELETWLLIRVILQ